MWAPRAFRAHSCPPNSTTSLRGAWQSGLVRVTNRTPVIRTPCTRNPHITICNTRPFCKCTRNPHITVCNTRPFCKCTRNSHITNCNTRPFLFFVIQRTFHITENENRKQSTDSCQDLFSVKSGSLKSVGKILDPDLTENRP